MILFCLVEEFFKASHLVTDLFLVLFIRISVLLKDSSLDIINGCVSLQQYLPEHCILILLLACEGDLLVNHINKHDIFNNGLGEAHQAMYRVP